MAAPRRVTLGAITPREWQVVLQAARELDLDRGGYWDGRSGAVNAWCGPDDKPIGWLAAVEITRGALPHPRSFVASCWLEWPEDGRIHWDTDQALPVVADITIYDVRDWQQRRDPKHVTGRVRGDVAWLKRHWRQLLALARARMPKPLRLELGATEGTCLRCGGQLRRIDRVLSSPWVNGVGDWRYWCPRCQILTLPAAEALARLAHAAPGAVDHVFAVGPVARDRLT